MKSEQQKLVKKLDKVFSESVRRKAMRAGYAQCYTCSAKKEYCDIDASHYVSRQHKATRWDERNVKACCQRCNRFLGGSLDEFALALIEEYGDGILEELNQAKYAVFKVSNQWLETQIKFYTDEVAKLK